MGKGKGVKEYFDGYPKHVFFILGNEFCERFSFYGMKAILVIYMTRRLLIEDSQATAIYHAFNMLCYFTPIFGAILADGYLGKFKTILYISILYAIGNVVMAITALWTNIPGPMIGLVLIGIGTGGIKPCVSAFGGDQFRSDQVNQLTQFFSVFYFSINLGSLISMILTPILRGDVKCFGGDCYPLAFGVPAALMIVAIVLFVVGYRWYTNIPPSGNVMVDMMGAVGRALKNKCGGKFDKKDHWLDYAEDKYDHTFLNDVKAVFRVLLLFLPLPVFWALFDQQGSRWTLQAGTMNGDYGAFKLKPDQIQALNPVLVILLIPVFESVIFPLLTKCKIPHRPLQRMSMGMFLAALSFTITGFVQLGIDNAKPQPIPGGKAEMTFVNAHFNCKMEFRSPVYNGTLDVGQSHAISSIEKAQFNHTVKYGCEGQTKKTKAVQLKETRGNIFTVGQHGQDLQSVVHVQRPKAQEGRGKAAIRVINMVPNDKRIRIKFTIDTGATVEDIINSTYLSASKYVPGEPGRYTMKIRTQDTSADEAVKGSFEPKNGGVYLLVLQPDTSDQNKKMFTSHVLVEANSVAMIWQIPQYIIMTVGEILFSITGLSFAYEQSPASMKSVLQAAWLLTVAFGNAIVLIVAAAGSGGTGNQALEFFIFAIVMAVDLVIYIILGIRFKSYKSPLEDNKEDLSQAPNGVSATDGDLPYEMVDVANKDKIPGHEGLVNRVFDKSLENFDSREVCNL
ncbi:unnamed protein product [Owenia fusiformis]|uniref:Uncharacterized protein n=1 Tax=Owenia fusiformis TaxID=6347 RepID=A0A8S4PN65_OWEFU|nr:unnamed protein product [Owenia fusiformis]